MTSETVNPGDVKITKISLHKISGGVVSSDFSDLVQSIEICESILYPVMTGTILMVDSVGLFLKKENAAGGLINLKMKVLIEYEVIGQGKRNYTFFVSKIQNSSDHLTSNFSMYTLHLVSMPFMNNTLNLIVNQYKQDTIDSYIKTILTNELKVPGSDLNYFEPTKGTPTFDNLLMKPFQAINYMVKQAVSLNISSNVFFFFENKNGFNLMTADMMLKDKSLIQKDHVFVKASTRLNEAHNAFYRNILDHSQISSHNQSKLFATGAYMNKTISFDVRTRTYTEQIHNWLNSPIDFKTNSTAYELKDKSFDGNANIPIAYFNYIKTSNQKNTKEKYLEEKIGRSAAFLEILMQNIISATVWGDPTLSAGHRLQMEVPTPYETSDEHKSKEPVKIKGEYIISKIKHILRKEKFNFRYYNILELMSPTYFKGSE